MAEVTEIDTEDAVRVFIRLRPLNKRELNLKETFSWSYNKVCFFSSIYFSIVHNSFVFFSYTHTPSFFIGNFTFHLLLPLLFLFLFPFIRHHYLRRPKMAKRSMHMIDASAPWSTIQKSTRL